MSATLSGISVSEATLHWPRIGVWSAEVALTEASELQGAVSLVLEDLTLAGVVVRGGPVEGTARYVVTGGAGGWRAPIKARAYRNDAGVKLSTVLADAAKDAGEELSFDAALARDLGPAFVRRAGPAWDVLGRLGVPWWMDANGVTQVRARPAASVSGPYNVIKWARDRGLREIACDSPAAFAPGSILEGAVIEQIAIFVTHAATRLRVWA